MDIRTIQELLGHNDIATTMIYTHVLARPDIHIVSPLDRLESCNPARRIDSVTMCTSDSEAVVRSGETSQAVSLECRDSEPQQAKTFANCASSEQSEVELKPTSIVVDSTHDSTN